MGVSANTTTRGVSIQEKQQGSLVQHNSVGGAGSNSENLIPYHLFQAYLSTVEFGRKCFLMIINSNCCKTKLKA